MVSLLLNLLPKGSKLLCAKELVEAVSVVVAQVCEEQMGQEHMACCCHGLRGFRVSRFDIHRDWLAQLYLGTKFCQNVPICIGRILSEGARSGQIHQPLPAGPVEHR